MGKKNKGKNKFKFNDRPSLYGPGGKSPSTDKGKSDNKKSDEKDTNPQMKVNKSSSKGKGNKYKPNRTVSAAAQKNIRDTEKAAKNLSNFKAPEMNVAEKKYTQNLPDRPSVPKLPTITTPGGNLNTTNVAKPSGRPGTINSYTAPVSDYKNVYKNLKRKQFQKP